MTARFQRPLRSFSRRFVRCTGPRAALAVAVVASVATASPAAVAGVRGTYKSPLGTVTFTEKDGLVTAKSTGGGPCQYKRGDVVIEGTRLDDSITGTVHACKVDGCSGKASGMIMLLLTQKNAVMSGAVHLATGKCKTPIRGDGITLTKTRFKRPPPKKRKQKAADRAALSSKAVAKAGSSQASSKRGGKAASKKTPREQALALATEAAALLNRGEAEKARALFEDAVDVDPTYSEGFLGIGVTYYMRDRYDEALAEYKNALEANPANRDIYYNMACIYALRGDNTQALEYLKIAFLNGYVQVETFAQDPDLKALEGDPTFEKMKTEGIAALLGP